MGFSRAARSRAICTSRGFNPSWLWDRKRLDRLDVLEDEWELPMTVVTCIWIWSVAFCFSKFWSTECERTNRSGMYYFACRTAMHTVRYYCYDSYLLQRRTYCTGEGKNVTHCAVRNHLINLCCERPSWFGDTKNQDSAEQQTNMLHWLHKPLLSSSFPKNYVVDMIMN